MAQLLVAPALLEMAAGLASERQQRLDLALAQIPGLGAERADGPDGPAADEDGRSGVEADRGRAHDDWI